MRKSVMTAFAAAFVVAMVAPTVIAMGPNGSAGESNVAFVYLVEKDPSTWMPVADGAWGKLKYNMMGPTFDVLFNGHLLMPGTDYTLIYYKDPWPGGGLVLASGTSDDMGDITLLASVTVPGGKLPMAGDFNAVPCGSGVPPGTSCTTYGDNNLGAKIWLVLSGDVDSNAVMLAWNPTEYLFETALISYQT